MANKRKPLDFIKRVKVEDDYEFPPRNAKRIRNTKKYREQVEANNKANDFYRGVFRGTPDQLNEYLKKKEEKERLKVASSKQLKKLGLIQDKPKYNFHFDNVGEEFAREQTGMRIRAIIIIMLLFIGIGVAIGVINLQTRVNEFTEEVEYLTTPLDKGMDLLRVVSDSGNELKTFVNDWGTDIQFVKASRFIPGPIGSLAKMLTSLQDTKIIKITKFVIGGTYEIVKIIIKGIGVIIT